MVSNGIIQFARNMTLEHEINYPNKVCAVLHRGSRVLSWGLNYPHKTHPKANTPYNTIHAEFDAIQRGLRNGLDMSRVSLYVYRLRRDQKAGLSRPCRWCERLIMWSGIKDVNWSVSE